MTDKEYAINFLEGALATVKRNEVSDVKLSMDASSIYFRTNIEPKKTYAGLCKDLKDLDACLVRQGDNEKWRIKVFKKNTTDKNCPFCMHLCGLFKQCIPHKGFEKYFNTTKDPLK